MPTLMRMQFGAVPCGKPTTIPDMDMVSTFEKLDKTHNKKHR